MNKYTESEVYLAMQYDVRLTKVADNGYVARPVRWPEVVASGVDEAEALASVRAALAEFLANSRVVQIDMPTTDETLATQTINDPWLRFAGLWADVPDEQWQRFQTTLAAGRQAVDHQADAHNTDNAA